ncbi:MAG: RNA polymerase Rpb1 domain 5 [Candidatus Micrarchaeum acidiphilum ARMAN-2]|jgi:DNA-directed RNA polymerase subunit A"|uniref:DNA-directed RNA polymerase n=1 Tax=Candidatus Micrarchaeum acidiphilum ARMAN-2 TaxID=425595 RepID=C7DHC3_MICA2|nr:MAG: RNA polymerase Rpb1 domain 5 [Candidatus Micrarchaeum acidiphilum ARMAN-2]
MPNKKESSFEVVSGEPVGVVAAQSFGEPSTQMVLRTFHSAGIASTVVTGLPRILEIIDARKKQKSPIMVIRLEKKDEKDYNKAKELRHRIEEVKVRSLISKFSEDLKTATMQLQFDKEKLDLYDTTLRFIVGKISSKFPEVEVSAAGNDLSIKYKSKKDIKAIRTTFVNIRNTAVMGVQGILKASVQQDDDGTFYITTNGSNMPEIINVEGVDKDRLYSNNLFDVFKVYGVEAARNMIANELKSTIENEGFTVSFRHVSLLADTMTYNGAIRSAGRHGIAGEKASVFARAAYEETVKHFVNASIFGEVDELKGVAENILIGKQIKVGTGRVKLVIKNEDLKKIKGIS